jgi:hypothetical protein
MMSNDTFKHPEFPFVQESLVNALRKAFHLVCPALTDTERQMFVMVGQRQIVEFLKERCRQQEEAIPENVLRATAAF